jgi:Spx/MgsR family transcriptional regulator
MTESITVYGIANCDTVRKARKWLDAHQINHEFHDYRKHGIDKPTLTRWCKALGWETLVNTRGTSWRKLPEADRQELTRARAIQLMMDNNSLIKRPVVDTGCDLLAGFDESLYMRTFT